MNTIAFDTLKLACGLEEAGFEHTQALKTAEILASTIGEAVVTRDHLDVRLKELETRLKYDLTIRLGGMLVTAIAVVVTLVKLL